MHIATVRKETFKVSWFLLDRGSVEAIFNIGTTEIEREKTRWGIVVAQYSNTNTLDDLIVGAAMTSKKDTFNVGRGMSISLQRALTESSLGEGARREVWTEVLANPVAGPLILNPETQRKWAKESAGTLQRRGKSLDHETGESVTTTAPYSIPFSQLYRKGKW